MSIKLCENCINDVKTSQEQPCLDCSKGSGWESKSVGCDFCNGEDVTYFDDCSVQICDVELLIDCDESYHSSKLKINYCPMCGRKLKGDENV